MSELRAIILQADDRPHEPVEVAEWGCTVVVWRMSEKVRSAFDIFNAELVEKAKGDNAPLFRARLIVDTTTDEAGELIFTHEDVPALIEKSSGPIRRLTAVALRVNQMRKQDLEELEKNSDATTANSSSSD